MEAITVAIAEAKRRGAKRIVCLGDVIGYGACPREALNLVRQKCEWCLFGNHEEALLSGGEDFNEKARAAIEWTRSVLSSRDFPREENYAIWDFLDALQSQTERREENAMFVHGSPFDPVREYVMPRDSRNAQKMARIFGKQDRQLCFVGHSHVPGSTRRTAASSSPTRSAARSARVTTARRSSSTWARSDSHATATRGFHL